MVLNIVWKSIPVLGYIDILKYRIWENTVISVVLMGSKGLLATVNPLIAYDITFTFTFRENSENFLQKWFTHYNDRWLHSSGLSVALNSPKEVKYFYEITISGRHTSIVQVVRE